MPNSDTSLVERLCVKDPADDSDPDWCRTHGQPWAYCKHRPLMDRLTQPHKSAGPTLFNPTANELEAAAAIQSAENRIWEAAAKIVEPVENCVGTDYEKQAYDLRTVLADELRSRISGDKG